MTSTRLVSINKTFDRDVLEGFTNSVNWWLLQNAWFVGGLGIIPVSAGRISIL